MIQAKAKEIKSHLSEKALEDLARSGLDDATIVEMGILPLNPKNYKIYFGESLIDKETKAQKYQDGYLIPYHGTARPYARLKILDEPLPKDRQGKSFKYLSPKGSGSHLYILPHDRGKLRSPKITILFVEGEKKTAAASQYARQCDDNGRTVVPVGAPGIYQFESAEELHELFDELDKITLLDFPVRFALDADFDENAYVVKAEYKLLAYCLGRGIPLDSITSVKWEKSDGKGIDDLLENNRRDGIPPVKVFEGLLQNAVSPFEKYRGRLSIDSACRALNSSHQLLRDDHINGLATALLPFYKKAGSTKTTIKSLLRTQRDQHRHKETVEHVEAYASLVQQKFGLEYTPTIPEHYSLHKGHLVRSSRLSQPLCPVFMIKAIAETEHPMVR